MNNVPNTIRIDETLYLHNLYVDIEPYSNLKRVKFGTIDY